jgi:hypothetical protein
MITLVWVLGLLLEDLEQPPLLCSAPLMSHGELLSGWLVMACWCGYRVARRAHSCRTKVIVRKLWQEPLPLPALAASEARR